MSFIPLLQKMSMLAMADSTLQSYLGAGNEFRWFDTQLPKGFVNQGACVTVQQVSTVPMYVQEGPLAMEEARVQINIWALENAEGTGSVIPKQIANYLCLAWFPSVSFASPAQFLSPPQTPPNFPNYKLSQRGVIDYSTQPDPAWVETIDMRVWNYLNG